MKTRIASIALAIITAAVVLTGAGAAGAETFFCDGSGDRVQATAKSQRVDRNANGYVCQYQWWTVTNPDHKHTAYYDDTLLP